MTNANDLLWWDTGDGDCKLVVGEYSLIVYCDDEQWYFSRQRNRGPWQLSNVPHPTREAAMQAAVDSAEAAGVDFSKAPRREVQKMIEKAKGELGV